MYGATAGPRRLRYRRLRYRLPGTLGLATASSYPPPYTAMHPVRQSGKTLFAAKGTNTRLVWAFAATECAVPAGCGWRSPDAATTAGTFSVGTSWSSVLLLASITPRMAAPWAVRAGAFSAVPLGGRAGVIALGASGLPDAAV